MFRCRQPTVGWPNASPRRAPLRAAGSFLMLVLPWTASAVDTLDALLARGVAQFERREFDAALASFDAAARLAPGDERPALWSGRAAGRLAEQSSPIIAFRLARRTLQDFERAYALNPRNLDVIDDLIEFHDKAPRFMGGSPSMAEQLRARRAALQAQTDTATR